MSLESKNGDCVEGALRPHTSLTVNKILQILMHGGDNDLKEVIFKWTANGILYSLFS